MSGETSTPAETVVPMLEGSITTNNNDDDDLDVVVSFPIECASPSSLLSVPSDDEDHQGGSEHSPKKCKVYYELQLPPCPTNPMGCKVHLLGTAHTSQESADEARRLVRNVKPDMVMVELCKARRSILRQQEVGKVPTLEEMIRDVRSGQVPIWGVLYSWLLAKVAEELGVLPGAEFRAAYEAAMEVGAGVVLGDRSVKLTLARTW